MQLQLNEEEQDLLRNLLEDDYEELRAEIRKTENHEFKSALRLREQLMEGLLEKLSGKAFAKTI
jgi:hypothetical protein